MLWNGFVRLQQVAFTETIACFCATRIYNVAAAATHICYITLHTITTHYSLLYPQSIDTVITRAFVALASHFLHMRLYVFLRAVAVDLIISTSFFVHTYQQAYKYTRSIAE